MNFKKLLDLFEAPSMNQTNTNIRRKIAPPTQAAVTTPTAASIIGNSPQVRASQTTPVANPGKPEAGVAFNQDKPPPAPTAASIIGNSPQVQASKSLPTTTAAAPVAAPVAATPNYKASVAFNQDKPPAPAAAPVAATPNYKASVAFNQDKPPAPAAAPASVPVEPAAVAGQRPGGIAFNQDAGAVAAEPAAPVAGQRPGGIAFNQDAGAVAAPAPVAATPNYKADVAFGKGNPASEPVQTVNAQSNATRPTFDVGNTAALDLNTRPGVKMYGDVSEEDEELNELMRLSGRPVNEKAVSKQQQKFMGMVHAMQKGKKIKGASPELKKVANTMNKKDAQDFASTKHNGLPKRVSESVMLEAGSALEHIINKFKHETKNFLAGEELDHDLFESLFDYYSDNGEMPYAIRRTAGDTDPYQWIDNKFEQDLSIMGYQRDFNAPNNLAHDHELTELARLAGLTNEDGPGASRLYTRDKSGMGVVPKDTPKDPGMGVAPKTDSLKDPGMGVAPKQTSLKDKMSNEDGPGASSLYGDDNKPSRKFDPIDTLKQVANKGIDTFNDYEQSKKDAWDSRAFGGTPGPGHSGYIPSRLPRFQTKSDSELADRKATDRKSHDLLTGANAAAASTPPADPGSPPNPKRVKEDAELNQMRRIAGLKEAQPKSPGAAPTHSARERERVVSPKVDKYDKDQEAAEKARRWMVDKESPNANAFGRKVGKAVAEPIAAIKSAWHGATDAWDHEMANDTAPDPKPPVSVVNKRDWKGDRDNPALKECGDMSMDSQQDSMNVSTNMSSDGNKSVNISAQGNKADSLLQILKMAGMRPYDDHEHAGMTEPEVIMIGSNDEEMMDEQYSNTPDEEYQSVDSIIRQGNDLNREKRQYAGKPRLGDNPMAEGVYDPDYRGNYNNEFDELEDLFSKSAMDSSEMNRQRFLSNKHGINSPADMSKLPALRKDAETGYKARKSEIDADTERKNQQYMQDKLMDLEYQADPSAFLQRRMPQSSTKDSSASSMDLPKADYSLGGRGAKLPNFNLEPAAPDANNLLDKATDQLDSRLRSRPSMSQQLAQLRNRTRQSRMAESLLDADLDAMLESILIREEDNPAKKVGDAVKNPSNAAKDTGDKVKGRLSFTKDTDGKTSVRSSTGRIKATLDGNKTYYEPGEPLEKEKTDEGMWDDVSNFVGDVVGTEASHLRRSQQLRDLDAMRKQYKGTPYEKQVNDRYDTHLNRLQLDKGDVMDYDPKTGIERLKPVVPPDQWKGGK